MAPGSHAGRQPAPPPIPPIVQEWLARLEAANLAEKTRRNYANDLALFAQYLGQPLEQASAADINGFLEALTQQTSHLTDRERQDGRRGVAPATSRRRLVALRQFYRYLVDDGHVPNSPAERIKMPKRAGDYVPDHFGDAEVAAIRRQLRKATTSAQDRLARARVARDRAMIELGLGGLRIAEVVSLRLDGLFRLDRNLVRILAKGNKDRLMPISDQATATVRAWVALRPPSRSNFVFTPVPPRGTRHLHYVVAERMVRHYYRLAGIAREIKRPFHALRHTAGTKLGEAGFELTDIQELLGHADPRTTKIYVRISQRRLRAVVRQGLRYPD